MSSECQIIEGDSLVVLPTFEPESFASCVTDPPYHLTANKKGGTGDASVNPNSPAGRSMISTGFMGKTWDGGDVAFRPQTWREVFRVLKPGAYLVAFGGTRTYHRMVCAIEDAGFEIRDQLAWVYGSGFPKSLNLHGEREGWGTALKPAWEPIVLARKPLSGTVAENVERHGTGALNIKGCRVPVDAGLDAAQIRTMERGKRETGDGWGLSTIAGGQTPVVRLEGRWPANLCHDGSKEALAAFPDSDGQQGDLAGHSRDRISNGIFGDMPAARDAVARGDRGSAARFFYCAKADRDDRDAGCEDLPRLESGMRSETSGQHITRRHGAAPPPPCGNNHPTVKPTDLMRWLCRLVTPPAGKVLDPFAGSGSTGRGASLEGFGFVGIEREPTYAAIARARITEAQGPLFT
jgi:site-specific DNA-methyltransferase (adenine-specific)